MEETVDKASYSAVAMTVSMITKDIELLEGRPTSREEYVLDEEEKAKYEALLDMNKEDAA